MNLISTISLFALILQHKEPDADHEDKSTENALKYALSFSTSIFLSI